MILHFARRALLPAALCTALIPLLAAQSAVAQTVRGRLLEQGTGQPIAGAFIVLLDEAGDSQGRDIARLTDTDGRFVLRVPEPGRYRLRAERIGFRNTLSEVIELEAGGTVELVIVAPVEPVALEELVVTGENLCDVRPEVGLQTAAIWEEARKALSVAAWTEAQGIVQYQLIRHERELDASGRRVREERTWPKFLRMRGSPFRSRPAEDLAELGYIQPTDWGGYTYFGPDASVVLSESFAELHCFGVREGRGDRKGLIGLTFEPVPGRELADVEGELWLDSETAELQYLEYRYTHLPVPIESDEIGGRVEFQRLPSGAWIVNRWWIRMPIVWQYRYDDWRPDQFRLEGIREEGGTVVDARIVEGRL